MANGTSNVILCSNCLGFILALESVTNQQKKAMFARNLYGKNIRSEEFVFSLVQVWDIGNYGVTWSVPGLPHEVTGADWNVKGPFRVSPMRGLERTFLFWSRVLLLCRCLL
jgi:hypothetical protein